MRPKQHIDPCRRPRIVPLQNEQIEWQAGKDTTTQIVKRRAGGDKKGKKGGGGGGATVMRQEPCESFFNFFRCVHRGGGEWSRCCLRRFGLREGRAAETPAKRARATITHTPHTTLTHRRRLARPRKRRRDSTPVVPESPDDLSEDDLEALQEQMDEDYEVGVAFKESLVPRAVEWFTGEASPPLYGDEDEGGEEDEGQYYE